MNTLDYCLVFLMAKQVNLCPSDIVPIDDCKRKCLYLQLKPETCTLILYIYIYIKEEEEEEEEETCMLIDRCRTSVFGISQEAE